MAQIMGYLIAGHHKGLEDDDEFRKTLTKPVVDPDPVWKEELAIETSCLLPQLKKSPNPNLRGFQLAFLGRMLFSCLIDADRRDTSTFDRLTHGRPPLERGPQLAAILDRCRDAYATPMEGFTGHGEINVMRRDILRAVRDKAMLSPGLFTLTVPTGGGKTLASLGFALDHAQHHKDHRFERSVYAIPFTSVIDQTAGIFERVLGKNLILAHHSCFNVEKSEDEKERSEDERQRLDLAM